MRFLLGILFNGTMEVNISVIALFVFYKKVTVSHSLVAIGAVGVRVPLYLGHS